MAARRRAGSELLVLLLADPAFVEAFGQLVDMPVTSFSVPPRKPVIWLSPWEITY